MGLDKFKYDIAISYSKEKRDFAQMLAEAFESEFSVFFDLKNEHLLSCRPLHEILHNIYYKESLFSIMIITKNFLERPHPLWEAYTIRFKNLCGQYDFAIILDDDVDARWVCEKLFINYYDFRFYRLSKIEKSTEYRNLFINEIKNRVINR